MLFDLLGLLKGPETEWTEPSGSEGSEPPQPGFWQRQKGQRQQCGEDRLGAYHRQGAGTNLE